MARSCAALVALSVSCASAPPTPPTAPVAEAPPAQRAEVHHASVTRCHTDHGGVVIEGQMGTLEAGHVRAVMRAAEASVSSCFSQRLEAVPCLAGRIELKLRVGEDGAVRWAIPTRSTLGDQSVERCMMDHARALRFQPPCGGEAEVTWPLEMDGGPDARAATEWPTQRLDVALRAHRAALTACRRSDTTPIEMTMYVAPDGSVLAAGTNVTTPDAVAVSDCVVHEAQTWRLPSPGSWYARVTVPIP